MDETTTEAPESAQDAPQSTESQSDGKGLRKQLETALAENRVLKADKRDGLLSDIGLNPEIGLGKVMAEKFDAGDVTLDTIQTVAIQDYGHVVPENHETHPQAQAIHDESAKLEQIGGSAGSVVPPDPVTDIQSAEQQGDWGTSIALKAQQVESMRP